MKKNKIVAATIFSIGFASSVFFASAPLLEVVESVRWVYRLWCILIGVFFLFCIFLLYANNENQKNKQIARLFITFWMVLTVLVTMLLPSYGAF
jgi:heme O synthase-like polyprenyltransferase